MKKTTYTPMALALLAASLTACDSGDAPVQHPDNYGFITFSAQTQRLQGESVVEKKLMTRANPYEAYDPQRHPLTMGVFGYYDIASYTALDAILGGSTDAASAPSSAATRAAALPNPVFSNATEAYNTVSGTWSDELRKRWDDYKGAKSFDFFAYMPQMAGATVRRTATDTYTLSVPFTMPEGKPMLFDTKQAPIVCALPEHKEGTNASGNQFTFERVVSMQFDQTLTGYTLHFRLDTKMGAIRSFRIKGVTLSGENAYSGTVSRTYTWADGSWTANAIQWSDLQRKSTADAPAPLPNKATDTQATDDEVVVSTNDFTQWGTAFYVIPDAQFLPTITVTYDVEFKAEDGTTVITRKGVQSTIVLNKKNFTSLATGKTAMISPIRILIQPRYLYVLADEDAYTGHLLIE